MLNTKAQAKHFDWNSFNKVVKLGNKAAKASDPAAGEAAPMDNSVSPLPEPEAPLAMMEVEKTPISTPMHDMPPPPDEK